MQGDLLRFFFRFSPFSFLKMNVLAPVYEPISVRIQRLQQTPFFQQRFQKTFHTLFRQDPCLQEITLLGCAPNLEGVQPFHKRHVFLLLSYRGRVFAYEADALENPRTGVFRLIQSL